MSDCLLRVTDPAIDSLHQVLVALLTVSITTKQANLLVEVRELSSISELLKYTIKYLKFKAH